MDRFLPKTIKGYFHRSFKCNAASMCLLQSVDWHLDGLVPSHLFTSQQTKAYGYFEKAANMRQDADSLFNAAHCLAHGLGADQDLTRCVMEPQYSCLYNIRQNYDRLAFVQKATITHAEQLLFVCCSQRGQTLWPRGFVGTRGQCVRIRLHVRSGYWSPTQP